MVFFDLKTSVSIIFAHLNHLTHDKYMYFDDKISLWYKNNARNLPWRNSPTPYTIWLSEIILQQTRVSQGLSYYYLFVNEFNSVCDLAQSPEDKVLKLWQGLGYYSRARNLHLTAKIVCEKYNGMFPNTFSELLKLKGIGKYTAAAIASIAFEEKVPAIDGNVHRVLSRCFLLNSPAGSPKAFNECFELSASLMQNTKPSIYNQAIMELGALVCTPKQPQCKSCPLNDCCEAYLTNRIIEFPVKKKAIVQKHRYLHYLILMCNDYIVLEKRGEGDIWQGLYQFPVIETEHATDVIELLNTSEWKKWVTEEDATLKLVHNAFKHVLSHQIIHSQFIVVQLNTHSALHIKTGLVKIESLSTFAVPRLIDRFLQKNFLK